MGPKDVCCVHCTAHLSSSFGDRLDVPRLVSSWYRVPRSRDLGFVRFSEVRATEILLRHGIHGRALDKVGGVEGVAVGRLDPAITDRLKNKPPKLLEVAQSHGPSPERGSALLEATRP